MYEILPILGGLIVGLLVYRLQDSTLRIGALALLCILVGLGASYLTGELLISWWYVVFDTAQALFGAVVVMILAPRLLRRTV